MCVPFYSYLELSTGARVKTIDSRTVEAGGLDPRAQSAGRTRPQTVRSGGVVDKHRALFQCVWFSYRTPTLDSSAAAAPGLHGCTSKTWADKSF